MADIIKEEYLNDQNIDYYFSALAEKILSAGIGEHLVLVVGGAAMALKYRDGRSTVDIDICIREQNHLYDCCQQVAEENGLPEDWMNADVMHSESFSYGLFENAVLYKTYRDILGVYVASDIDLYCMKLVSFRPKDVQDMEVLSSALKKQHVGPDDIIDHFIRLYGDTYLMKNDDRKERFLRMQFR